MKIEVKGVSKCFSDHIIFNDVNLTFESGKIYGLVGCNGSGKSVFLKLLCSFYAPSSGEILYDGEDIVCYDKFPPRTRALIEKPHFIPDLSGFDNLKLLASIENIIGDKEINDVLKKVGLYDDKDKLFHKYSLGMKQKLGIAQVLMENPDVMILDEVFNGLDDSSCKTIRELLLSEVKKGKIIILATHIKDDIEILCDEVYKIDNKKILKIK